MKIYLAGPIKKHRQTIEEMAKIMREANHEVYLPSENKIDNAWDLPNDIWGKKVFDNDVEAINNCDMVVVASYDNSEHHGGTRWESGYAYGIGKRVVVVHFEQEEVSLMIANGCFSNLNGLEEFRKTDLNTIEEKKCDLPQT